MRNVDTADCLNHLAGALRVAVLRLSRQLRLQGVDELSPTAGITLAALQLGGPLTISELAAREHVSLPTMSAVVAKLEERQFVRRRRDPSDGRVCRVEISESGCDYLDANRSQSTASLARQLEVLSAAERRLLAEAVALIDSLGARALDASQ